MDLARDGDDELVAAFRELGLAQRLGWRRSVRAAARRIIVLLARRDGVSKPRLRVLRRSPPDYSALYETFESRRRRPLIRLYVRDPAGTLISPDDFAELLFHEWTHHTDSERTGRTPHSRRFYRAVRSETAKLGTVDPLVRFAGFVAQCVAEAAYERWIGPLPPRKR